MSRLPNRLSRVVLLLATVATALAAAPLSAQRPRSRTNAAALGQHVDSARVAWVPNPRAASDGRVADPSRHLAPSTVAAINDTLRALERATGVEVAVVVVDSTRGLEPSDFALALLRYWGVGKRETNNGVIFLWVPARRATHIVVGDGMEGALTDARAGRILDQHVIPAFRRGAFDEGIVGGVRAIAEVAREEFGAGGRRRPVEAAPVEAAPGAAAAGASAPSRLAAGSAQRPEPSRGGGGGLLVLLGVGAVGVIGGAGWLVARGRRAPECPDGHGPMRLVPDAQDDELLSRPELAEERVGSVDHKVWRCEQCGITRKRADRKWFSGYGDCPGCGRRTMRTESRTIRRATTHSEGLELVTERCEFCGRTGQHHRTTPRVVQSSGGGGSSSGFGGGGGSSGGGSSWGGGSSRGGGAGRSY